MKQGLSQQQTLKQTIAPQMVLQLVPYLMMNKTEIEDCVKHEIEDNGALEAKEHDDEKDQKELNGDTDDNSLNDGNDSGNDNDEDSFDDNDNSDADNHAYEVRRRSGSDSGYTPTAVSEISLAEYLIAQINERDITREQQIIAEYIVGNLDSNGWLLRSASAIADDITFNGGEIEVETQDVEEVLQMVRQLDPPGIACSNLQECIILQLRRMPASADRDMALQLVTGYFGEMVKHHYDKIVQDMQISNDMLRHLMRIVTKTNPRPGSAYSSGVSEQHSQQITPDFEVEINENAASAAEELKLYLLNNIPELQISANYAEIYKRFNGKKVDKTKDAQVGVIRRSYEKANNFITLIKQRQNTLFSIMQSIVMRQHDFFMTGDKLSLKPMTLRDVSADTGLDVSVVSRGTRNKWVTTPWGVFPLKHFFSASLDGDVSSKEVQTVLQKLIDNENKHHPLSDDRLCKALAAKGYKLARRTVAKYREKLNVPTARLRKEV